MQPYVPLLFSFFQERVHKNAVKIAVSLDIQMLSNIRRDFEAIDRQISANVDTQVIGVMSRT